MGSHCKIFGLPLVAAILVISISPSGAFVGKQCSWKLYGTSNTFDSTWHHPTSLRMSSPPVPSPDRKKEKNKGFKDKRSKRIKDKIVVNGEVSELMNGKSADKDSVIDAKPVEANDKSAKNSARSPSPPHSKPFANITSYDDLLELSFESSLKVSHLEGQIELLKNELVMKQEQLKTLASTWEEEKEFLLMKNEEDTEERDRLAREVELLQDQLPALQNVLRMEQRKTAELQDRLQDTDYTLEYQQMEFEKDKKELLNQLELSQEELKKYTMNFKEQEGKYKMEQEKLKAKLDEEQSRVKQASIELNQQRELFSSEKATLEKRIKEQREKLENTQRELDSDRASFALVKSALKADIAKEQQRLQEAEESLKTAENLFAKIEQDYKEKLEFEQTKVQNLETRLENEKAKYTEQRLALEKRLRNEEEAVAELKAKLREERLDSAKVKLALEEKLENEIRVNKLKKRQMKDRYDSIREEMTALWQGAKRDARKEISNLKKKYESRIMEMQANMEQLEADLKQAHQSTSQMQKMVEDVARQKDQAMQERNKMEKKYLEEIENQNKEIFMLKQDVKKLRKVLAQKEAEITLLKSSVRKMMGQTLSLSWRRLISPFRRLLGKKQK